MGIPYGKEVEAKQKEDHKEEMWSKLFLNNIFF
jgi:hypothetical protein